MTNCNLLIECKDPYEESSCKYFKEDCISGCKFTYFKGSIFYCDNKKAKEDYILMLFLDAPFPQEFLDRKIIKLGENK